jgi:lysozyme family protein
VTPATFEACLADVFQFDGFKDDRAPGESFATTYGVTEYTWGDAINEGLVENKPISQATRDDCVTILRVKYWNAIHASQLPAGVNLMVFNDATLCGVGHAVALLQRILRTRPTRAVDADTIQLAGSFGDRALIDAIHDGDDAYFETLRNAPKYLGGWERREDVMRAHAYQMAGITAAPVAVQITPVAVQIAPTAFTADALNDAELKRIT